MGVNLEAELMRMGGQEARIERTWRDDTGYREDVMYENGEWIEDDTRDVGDFRT